MVADGRTFVVASDEALIKLILGARNRLVVIAPALTQAVADALSERLHDLNDRVTIILDSDPEVYRLGFGDQAALDKIREVSADSHVGLREQRGVRIGVVIADDTTMVFSPVSRNIEAGSTSMDKPNAIVLSGNAANRLATAAGSDSRDDAPPGEVGTKALDAAKVLAMQADLKANPPKPFDITRKMNVFSSRVQYVEFSASNYRLTTRQIPLPPELIDVDDADLKNRINSRIRPPFDGIGKLAIRIESGGKSESIQVDDTWLKNERKRIEDEFTFQINNFGRVILYGDREAFDNATSRFKQIIEAYQKALSKKLVEEKTAFEERIVEEFWRRWENNPPKYFARWNLETSSENIRRELGRLAEELFKSAISFEAPVIKILYKNVAPENIRDSSFLESLRRIMIKRRVPPTIIDTLFESGEAAPESGAFFGR
ncbi:hypothetical protein V4R08_14680 [Nitrobacter sp. NHB1]|uniref:hypothetical protein n=1 Tax=Nitrobacter sp. NHB1 TaxID=3119830 RepID=UPI002FFFA876